MMWAWRLLALGAGASSVFIFQEVSVFSSLTDHRSPRLRSAAIERAVVSQDAPKSEQEISHSIDKPDVFVLPFEVKTTRQQLKKFIWESDAEIFRAAVRQLRLPVLSGYESGNFQLLSEDETRSRNLEMEKLVNSAKGLKASVKLSHGLELSFLARRKNKAFFLEAGSNQLRMKDHLHFEFFVETSFSGGWKNQEASTARLRIGADRRSKYEMVALWGCVNSDQQPISHVLYRQPFAKDETLQAWAYNLPLRKWYRIGQGQTWSDSDTSIGEVPDEVNPCEI